MIIYLTGGDYMFKFSIDDQKKYKKGDFVNGFKISNYIDEPIGPLAQHLAAMYGELLHITMQFNIEERDINLLAFEYLEECFPEDVEKLIKGRMKRSEYQYDITRVSKE